LSPAPRTRRATDRHGVVRVGLTPRRPPSATLFPYTTLFRSSDGGGIRAEVLDGVVQHAEVLELLLPNGFDGVAWGEVLAIEAIRDRKSTRLNSSHVKISYAVLCLQKKSGGE